MKGLWEWLKLLLWLVMLSFVPGLIIFFGGIVLQIIVYGTVAVALVIVSLFMALLILARLTRLLGITPQRVDAFFNRITPSVRRIQGKRRARATRRQ